MALKPVKEERPHLGCLGVLIIFGCAGIALFFVIKLHLGDKWLIAGCWTGAAIAFLLTTFRKKVSSKVLWIGIGTAFLFHIPLMWVVFGVIFGNSDAVRYLYCLPIMIADFALLNYWMKFLKAKIPENPTIAT